MEEKEQPSSKRFGAYIVLDRIGSGGMAEIFLAKRQGYSGFEKVVALKKILPNFSEKPAFAQMLIHEAKLAAKLQHLNVVQVLDLGEFDSQVYIAMEYVHGRDLSAVLSSNHRRKETIPVAISLCIAIEFLTGLDYAHRLQDSNGEPMGLIHRDISPQNILLSYEGEVKVTDFGIARAFSPEASFVLPGSLQGKFGYMSPEQILKKKIDQRADIFSAGVVLHELLTGKRLYRAKTPQETAKLILKEPAAKPSLSNPELPEMLDELLAKALHLNRDERYQTVGSFLGDLARCADQLPQQVRRRDLAVYMRRQFGSGAPRPRSSAPARGRSSQVPRISLVSNFSATSGDRKPVGDILISREIISISQLDIALAQQRARGGRLGEILIETDIISERELAAALAEQIAIPLLDSGALLKEAPSADLFKLFPLEAAHSMCVFPMSIDSDANSASIAVADPFNARVLLEAKVILGVNTLNIRLSTRAEIREAISKWYDQQAQDSADLDSNQDLPITTEALPPCVLIADSDAENAEALAARIRDEECEVFVVGNGKDAREICKKQKIAVAFIETNLPKIDGYNILLELRGQNPEAAIFMTSNRVDEFHQTKAIDLGADDFLAKPLNIEITTAKLRREIQKRAAGYIRPAARATSFAGVSGSLEDMTFIDVFQSIELAKKTAVIIVQYDDGRAGEVVLERGKARWVECGELNGEEAFYALADMGPGLFRIEYRASDRPNNLKENNSTLLMEALRRIDDIAIIDESSVKRVTQDWDSLDKTPTLGHDGSRAAQKDQQERPETGLPTYDGEIEGALVDDLVLTHAPPASASISDSAAATDNPDAPKSADPADEATMQLSTKMLHVAAASPEQDVDESNVFVWSPIVGSDDSVAPPPESPAPAVNLEILAPEEEKTELPIPPEQYVEDATEIAFDAVALKRNMEASDPLSVLPNLDPESLFQDFDSPGPDSKDDPLAMVPLNDSDGLFEGIDAPNPDSEALTTRQEALQKPAHETDVQAGKEDELQLPANVAGSVAAVSDGFVEKRPDREGPAQVKPPQHFSAGGEDVFSLPALPGQEATPVAAEPAAADPKPLPLPANALTECEPPHHSSRLGRDHSSGHEGQSLARLSLQKKAVPRKESNFGGASVEKVAVKHVDHSRQKLTEPHLKPTPELVDSEEPLEDKAKE